MKKAFWIFSLSAIFLISACSPEITCPNQTIRYYSSLVTDVNNDYIKLKLGPTLRLDKRIIALNLTKLFLVLDEDKPTGFAYIKDQKVGATLVSNPKSIVLADNKDLMIYDTGRLAFIKNFSKVNRMLELSNGSSYLVLFDDAVEALNDWASKPDIIVPTNLEETLILPFSGIAIKVKPANRISFL
ncbi:MAG: hypothetical protein PHW27_01070 [Melioribacteraceae bacterium]|nr:hypothetical protein [Melioribacteraceae bacterium]MDD3557138.1 hypothetical protein [Melioribacteraceae bacterium]